MKYEVLAEYEELPVGGRIVSTLAVGLILGSTITLAYWKFYTLFLRRYPTQDWITPDLYAKKRWITGVVTRDSDDFDLYHTPCSVWYWRYWRTIPQDLKDQTIHIRLAGIDAPECGNGNKEPQPFSRQALNWLKKKVLGKAVCCQLLKRDLYGRTIAAVVLPYKVKHWVSNPEDGTPLAYEMLRAGLAVTYKEPRAVYGHGGLKEHLSIEAEARRKRRGLWRNGPNIETPAQYRRRHRIASALTSYEESDFLTRRVRRSHRRRK